MKVIKGLPTHQSTNYIQLNSRVLRVINSADHTKKPQQRNIPAQGHVTEKF